MKKNRLLLYLLSVYILILSGCSLKTQEPISKTGIYFDTEIQIDINDSNDTGLLDQCFEQCQVFEQTISRTIETSEIYKINHANGKAIEVSD